MGSLKGKFNIKLPPKNKRLPEEETGAENEYSIAEKTKNDK